MPLETMRPLAALLTLACLVGCAGGPEPSATAPADALALTDVAGQDLDLDAALERGESVALIFWQTWCESCEKEAPTIAAASRDEGERIRFVSVVPGKESTVDLSEVEAKRQAWGYGEFPLVRDTDLSLSRSLGVRGTPTIVVLGRGRSIRYREHRPPSDWASLRGAPLSAAPRATNEECEDGVCPLPGVETP